VQRNKGIQDCLQQTRGRGIRSLAREALLAGTRSRRRSEAVAWVWIWVCGGERVGGERRAAIEEAELPCFWDLTRVAGLLPLVMASSSRGGVDGDLAAVVEGPDGVARFEGAGARGVSGCSSRERRGRRRLAHPQRQGGREGKEARGHRDSPERRKPRPPLLLRISCPSGGVAVAVGAGFTSSCGPRLPLLASSFDAKVAAL
jgi:hypothetical protein